MDKKNLLNVEVVTPTGEIYKGFCRSVQAPGVEGLFQVLPGHTSFLTRLGIGVLKLEEEGGEEKWIAVSGGFFQVVDDKISVLADAAERSEDIDIERAKQAEERALRRIREKGEGIDLLRAEAALARAMNRLKVARMDK